MHEMIEEERRFLGATLLSASGSFKERDKVQDIISDLYAPDAKVSKKKESEDQVAYLESVRDVDWGKVFRVVDSYAEDRKEEERRKGSALYGSYVKKSSL